MDKKLAREIVESLPSLYPLMTADEEEAIWTVLVTDKNVGATDARQDFMDIVYSELHSDGDNNRANRIIDAADEYAESAQLGTNLAEVGTDMISRQAALDIFDDYNVAVENGQIEAYSRDRKRLCDLPPAQPEQCEDAVSRKDCLKALSNMMDTDGFRNGWAVSRANVECMLKAMPSVMPKQRTGHWIPVGMVEVVGGESAQWGSAVAYHKCSECDEQALRDDFEQEVLSKWCPHCGAKMERSAE